jgi:hypothetical protein
MPAMGSGQTCLSRSPAVIVLLVVTLRGRLLWCRRAIFVLRFRTLGRGPLLFALWLHVLRLRALLLHTLRRRALLHGWALELLRPLRLGKRLRPWRIGSTLLRFGSRAFNVLFP